MELNLRGVVRYDGTAFAGWQIQPGLPTIQGALEGALARIASQPVRVYGAARTDAGVHALGQGISFRWPAAKRCPENLAKSLSKMLTPDIRVESLEAAPPEFHARYTAQSKHYAYTLSLDRTPDPFTARYAWDVPWPLDLECLSGLLREVQGTHDFAGFQASGAARTRTVRTLHAVSLRRGGVIQPFDAARLWRIDFHGDAFLYKMVRNIVGTAVDIARGQLPRTRLAELLDAPGPFLGRTAPARGLALVAVHY